MLCRHKNNNFKLKNIYNIFIFTQILVLVEIPNQNTREESKFEIPCLKPPIKQVTNNQPVATKSKTKSILKKTIERKKMSIQPLTIDKVKMRNMVRFKAESYVNKKQDIQSKSNNEINNKVDIISNVLIKPAPLSLDIAKAENVSTPKKNKPNNLLQNISATTLAIDKIDTVEKDKNKNEQTQQQLLEEEEEQQSMEEEEDQQSMQDQLTDESIEDQYQQLMKKDQQQVQDQQQLEEDQEHTEEEENLQQFNFSDFLQSNNGDKVSLF